ncbi:MAG: hypothetical protein ACYTG5_11150 [Planctomycetota bacterium]|jgi:hypothetical protein
MRSLAIVLSSLGNALRYPRVWLTAWLLVTIPALLIVYPVYLELEAEMAQNPGAGFLLDQSLDEDFLRQHPGLGSTLLGGSLFMIIAWAFLSGAVLKTMRSDLIFGFTAFLVAGGKLFFRNLRVLVIGLVPAAALFWGTGAFQSWLMEGPLVDADPGATALPLWLFDIRWAHVQEGILYLEGLLFILLLFMSKVAMAHLAVDDKRSALLAWGLALGKILRHPLRASLLVLLLTLVFLAVPSLMGIGTAWALEVEQNLWLGLLFGQLAVIASQIVLLASLLSARQFLSGAEEIEESETQPEVDLARRVSSPKERSTPRASA